MPSSIKEPTELPPNNVEADPAEPVDGAQLVWLPATDFGRYLTKAREARHLSLRKAGELIGVSHTHVKQMESAEGGESIGVERLEDLADTYEVPLPKMLTAAGARYVMEDGALERLEVDTWVKLERLLLSEHVRPPSMDVAYLDCISPKLRDLLIELAIEVEANTKIDGPSVAEIMASKEAE